MATDPSVKARQARGMSACNTTPLKNKGAALFCGKSVRKQQNKVLSLTPAQNTGERETRPPANFSQQGSLKVRYDSWLPHIIRCTGDKLCPLSGCHLEVLAHGQQDKLSLWPVNNASRHEHISVLASRCQYGLTEVPLSVITSPGWTPKGFRIGLSGRIGYQGDVLEEMASKVRLCGKRRGGAKVQVCLASHNGTVTSSDAQGTDAIIAHDSH
ncbi:hypothetical protein Bbelb_321370 [Branchiostoma belcheri]|nr:hypothetical protein Bbelb_321370 [Branchiostoma belcheri]